MAQEGSHFNLKAVVRQTGLKPDTLRAWERRYGLPAPERSGGGHRLYTQRDINTIQWLMARQEEGLSISRAVELWQQLEAEGHDPLRSRVPAAAPPLPAAIPHAGGATLDHLRGEWVRACLNFDEQAAEQVVTEAFALYPPETVSLELLQKAVSEIGAGWYRGDVTVQQEHFCSALVIRRLEALIMAASSPSRPGRILTACPPQENHVIGLLLLTLLLRRQGWEVVYLGADVPEDRMEATVRSTRPSLVILAAQQLHTAATLLEMAQGLHRQGIIVAYGGLIFNLRPELRECIPAYFLGERLDSAPQVVEMFLAEPQPAPGVTAVPERYHRAREHWYERQGAIESRVVQLLGGMPIAPRHVAMANQELGLNIGAALTLGDMDALGTDLEWVEGLMSNRQMPAGSLYRYLHAYYQAARDQLDERGEPILHWLGQLVGGEAEQQKEGI